MISKPVVVGANVEKLVETNQLLTNVNNLIQPSTISTDKVELMELPKDSILPTGFRFIDLSILSYVLSFRCVIHPVRCVFFMGVSKLLGNTLKPHDIEGKKRGLARFMQIKCRDCEFKYTLRKIP